jgi:hypothetical protein
MKTADLITSYLSNEMSPEQERQFLLSVAASDSLRLSLKSHVMLDKIVTNQIQRAHVPENVRDAIFNQMNASLTGIAPLGAASAAEADALEGASLLSRLFNGATGRFSRGALVALLTIGGFAAGYFTRTELAPAPPAVVASAPAATGTSTAAKPAPGAPASSTVATQSPAPAVTANTAAASDAAVAEKSTIADASKPSRASRLAPAMRQSGMSESTVRPQAPALGKHAPAAAESSKSSPDHKTVTPPESEAGGNGQNNTIGRSGTAPVKVDADIQQEPIKTNDHNGGGPRDQ